MTPGYGLTVAPPAVRLAFLFAGWTLFVWGTRISNILDDGGSVGALAVAVFMVTLAVATLAAVVFRRWLAPVVLTLAGATILVWLARLPGLLLDSGHRAPFKLVHTALALVSIALAVKAMSAVRAPRPVPA